jgi:GR25 family glycosyltransferase involved in LPS biosynthesis
MIAYVINLDHRKDKWRASMQELAPHFNLERVSAIKNKWGWLGLWQTFKKIFQECEGDVLIFEDDATYRGWATSLENAIKDLPPDWDMLMLGANIKDSRLDRVSNQLVRTYESWTTHGILYSYRFAKEMAELDLTIPIDEYFRTKVHPKGNSYICVPFLSYQRPSESDIEGGYKNYTSIFEQSEAKALHFVNQ